MGVPYGTNFAQGHRGCVATVSCSWLLSPQGAVSIAHDVMVTLGTVPSPGFLQAQAVPLEDRIYGSFSSFTLRARFTDQGYGVGCLPIEFWVNQGGESVKVTPRDGAGNPILPKTDSAGWAEVIYTMPLVNKPAGDVDTWYYFALYKPPTPNSQYLRTDSSWIYFRVAR